MLFSRPTVMHSTTDDGRHWLTTFDFPPLQILPVAGNHCRAGHMLARALSAVLSDLDETPEMLTLHRDQLIEAGIVNEGPAETNDSLETVRIPLAMMGRDGQRLGDNEDEDSDESAFLTPHPGPDWSGSYDDWIRHVTRSLGFDTPVAKPATAYDEDLAAAVHAFQVKVPALRERFLAGMGDLNLGFKIPLEGKSVEYVWVSPVSWDTSDRLMVRLESRPRNGSRYKPGNIFEIAADQLTDYAIGSPEEGLVESGDSQRVAENYGHIIA